MATLPAYQTQALARADRLAQLEFGPQGVCMGYDFHLGADGAQLIEVNTNAGGLLLNAALARAQDACCTELAWAFASPSRRDTLKQSVLDMFSNEWQRQRGDKPWRNVLIVDADPAQQYLAPEFELFRQLFDEHGIHASIADPAALQWDGAVLRHQGQAVDMVYNRLTDFYLQDPAHLALREAYAAGAVVLTPHPRAHALLADKRNLIVLSSDERLSDCGATSAERAYCWAPMCPPHSWSPTRWRRHIVGTAPRPVLQTGGRVWCQGGLPRRQTHPPCLGRHPGW
jgi:hypothetical protein